MKGGAGCCGGEGWREGGVGKGDDVTRGTVTARADASGVTAGMGKRQVRRKPGKRLSTGWRLSRSENHRKKRHGAEVLCLNC